jgi:hypothetical protein
LLCTDLRCLLLLTCASDCALHYTVLYHLFCSFMKHVSTLLYSTPPCILFLPGKLPLLNSVKILHIDYIFPFLSQPKAINSDLAHFISQLLWVSANIVWAGGELFDPNIDDKPYHLLDRSVHVTICPFLFVYLFVCLNMVSRLYVCTLAVQLVTRYLFCFVLCVLCVRTLYSVRIPYLALFGACETPSTYP